MKKQYETPFTLLESLPKSVQKELRSSKNTVKYQPKEQILRQEEQTKDVYFINYGKVRITLYTQRGYKLSFIEIPSGQSFGEMAAIDQMPRSANVIAIEETSLTRIPYKKFERLLKAHPKLSHFIMRQMSGIIRRLNDRLYELSALDSTHRVYAELIRMAKKGKERDGMIIVNNPLTQAELASRVASHREAVNRVYKVLFGQGIIEKRAKQLVFHDVKQLEQRIEDQLNS